jgi:hypothetical protein
MSKLKRNRPPFIEMRNPGRGGYSGRGHSATVSPLNEALLTRATVWLALLCYAVAVVTWARGEARDPIVSRLLWVLGCAFFLAHILAAFHFYHHWSHAAAAQDTQRETIERLRVNFRGGVYFNYLFALIWLVDIFAGNFKRGFLHERNRVWFLVLHGFFVFMIFNATVVFGRGWARPAGGVLCLIVLAALWLSRQARA